MAASDLSSVSASSRGIHVATAPERREFYIPSLDGMRAIAFFIVFFSHVGPLHRLVPGGFGVTIFFFLSGYLITTLLRLEDQRTGDVSLKHFYLRRVLRILPPMYIALAIAIGCSSLVGARVSGRVVALQAIQLTNYHVAFGGLGHPLGTEVLWSLSVEEHFYLLFPIAYLALRRRVRRIETLSAILLAACGLLLAWRIFVVLGLRLGPAYTMHATDTRMDAILFGCAFALFRNPALPGKRFSERATWLSFALALPVLALTVAARGPVFRETLRYTIQGLALAPVFLAAIRFPHSIVFRWLNSRIMRWLGVLSYSLYLVHLSFVETLRLTSPLSEIQVTVVALFLSIAVAAAMYYLVERPCATLRKKLTHLGRVR